MITTHNKQPAEFKNEKPNHNSSYSQSTTAKGPKDWQSTKIAIIIQHKPKTKPNKTEKPYHRYWTYLKKLPIKNRNPTITITANKKAPQANKISQKKVLEMTNIAIPTITHRKAELHPDLILMFEVNTNYIAERKVAYF